MRGTCNRLKLMLQELEVRENELELSLDERSNKLLFAEVIIVIVSVSAALVSAAAGLFGMNLWNGARARVCV
jgi:hypothetical protein